MTAIFDAERFFGMGGGWLAAVSGRAESNQESSRVNAADVMTGRSVLKVGGPIGHGCDRATVEESSTVTMNEANICKNSP